MGSEKRKATDAWTEATLLKDDHRRGIYIASFSGVIPPPETTFREYKRIRKDRKDEKDVILQGETERIEFEGRTKSKDNDDTCQYPYAQRIDLIADMRFVFITLRKSR
jgi:A49-like RNA polymerase I associated factor